MLIILFKTWLHKRILQFQQPSFHFYTFVAPFASCFRLVQTNTNISIVMLLMNDSRVAFGKIHSQLLGNVDAEIQQRIALFPWLITNIFIHNNECIRDAKINQWCKKNKYFHHFFVGLSTADFSVYTFHVTVTTVNRV